MASLCMNVRHEEWFYQCQKTVTYVFFSTSICNLDKTVIVSICCCFCFVAVSMQHYIWEWHLDGHWCSASFLLVPFGQSFSMMKWLGIKQGVCYFAHLFLWFLEQLCCHSLGPNSWGGELLSAENPSVLLWLVIRSTTKLLLFVEHDFSNVCFFVMLLAEGLINQNSRFSLVTSPPFCTSVVFQQC
jgi:hypothetical protein